MNCTPDVAFGTLDHPLLELQQFVSRHQFTSANQGANRDLVITIDELESARNWNSLGDDGVVIDDATAAVLVVASAGPPARGWTPEMKRRERRRRKRC